MNYRANIPIHKRDDELSFTHSIETDNEGASTTPIVVVPDLRLHMMQCELEVAIDEHLELLRENKILKESCCEKRVTGIELEYYDLSMEHDSLLADVTRKRKEVMACKRIIQILQGEITKSIGLQSVVDLTNHPDY
ncbi:unnamed protein product [Cylindrotheca closterium]|uniref:Uncharacterized protein n=1 Tax=Cylindrotheca closterium TaxID=2856 RepID=A0AAD2CRD5_9STRA|nr:unnamed protein product [Cylindrotheca closterium]